VVEHPLRKRVVGGSNPSIGTTVPPIETWSTDRKAKACAAGRFRRVRSVRL